MKINISYTTKDGKKFDNQRDVIKHLDLLEEVATRRLAESLAHLNASQIMLKLADPEVMKLVDSLVLTSDYVKASKASMSDAFLGKYSEMDEDDD